MSPIATLALAASLVLGLLGCASTPTVPTPAPTVTVTVTPKPAPTTPAPIESLAPDAAATDWTAEMQKAEGAAVVVATETEPGRIEIETTLTDPRGSSCTAQGRWLTG